jgi:hypothetical protein
VGQHDRPLGEVAAAVGELRAKHGSRTLIRWLLDNDLAVPPPRLNDRSAYDHGDDWSLPVHRREISCTGLVGCYGAEGQIVVAVISVFRVDGRGHSECVEAARADIWRGSRVRLASRRHVNMASNVRCGLG